MRTALVILSLGGLMGAANVQAAPIEFFPTPNHLQVHPAFVDVTKPTTWAVKSPTGPNPFPNEWTILTLSNAGTFPPVWVFNTDFWVDNTEGAFNWTPSGTGMPDKALVDVAEFIAAGDTQVTMRVDSATWGFGPWNTITWESPHLGVITRTYFRTPEPGAVALVLPCLSLLARRRRQTRSAPGG